ncbi:hypothetical protein TorRG33x02_248430 [Trema orientale]|uniref:RNase H type-1 domain-containing protein n=1 Tax=Trema orientale TaxID=63057 RepID=A0A2P5DKG0_TREOI|nr:hypothetical protein TorRG33x02_248430 [Trema orientale]
MYESIFGQKINFEKSAISFSPCVGENTRQLLKTCLGLTQNSDKVVSLISLAPPWVDKWHKPSIGLCKLNTDAAVRHGTGSFGMGGVIRDYDGLDIACFSKLIKGSLSIENCELIALKEDLLFVQQFKLLIGLIECDSSISAKSL